MKVSIDQLQPGMVLAEDLRNDMGRFLMGAGSVIEEKHFRIFKIWGVFEVDVQGDEPAAADQDDSGIDEVTLARAREYMTLAFASNNMDHYLVREVFALSTEWFARRLAEKTVSIFDLPGGEVGDLPRPTGLNPAKLVTMKQLKLGAVPALLAELMEVINNPRSSSYDISRVVEKDTSLAARLLKIVNSPFYGFPGTIDTISRAVTVVGTRQLSTLAVGVAAIDAFSDMPSEIVNMEAFWRHSLYTGFCARVLAGYTTTSNPERFFVSGLLHDIGKLVLYKLLPKEMSVALQAALILGKPARSQETKIFGFDHARVGGELLKSWNFPVVLESSIRYHHTPTRSPYPVDAGIVNLCNFITQGIGVDGYGMVLDAFDPSVWNDIGLPDFSLSAVVKQADSLYDMTARYFLNHD